MNVVPLSRHAKPTWEEALEDFLNLKGAEGRAPRTLTDYRKDVPRFFNRFPLAYENGRKARWLRLRLLLPITWDLSTSRAISSGSGREMSRDTKIPALRGHQLSRI